MANKIHIKVFACLMALWYLVSAVGLNVHTCSGTGEVFVSSLAAGTSCEVIHPSYGSHSEKDCCCCGHENETEEGVSKQDCCNNESVMLVHNGCTEDSFLLSQLMVQALDMNCFAPETYALQGFNNEFIQRKIPEPDSIPYSQRDILSEISIWRL